MSIFKQWLKNLDLKYLSFILGKYKFHLLFIAIGIVYFFNMFIDVMEVDAAQYALISMEMSWTKSFLHVFQQGQDYLDKPPLLFWLSSLSFIAFGISNFTYKLPSVLIAIIGIYSVYKFSRIYYNKEKSILAALMLAGCQALFLITNDVRTDTNLLGLMMFSIWQMSEYLRNKKWKNLVFASIGIGGAMLAKGPVALIILISAFGTHFLLKRQWKNIFKPQWIVVIIIVAIILLPMSYGLYTQFDLHPEKTAYGLTGPSGLKFYYWTQSFGRITGENYWHNDFGFFYFFHTILWDFQPWVLFFIPALILGLKNIVMRKFRGKKSKEYITIGGFVFVFIAFSLSNYKLPHYIFVLFPFASIITANFIINLKDKIRNRVSIIYFGIMHVFWFMMIINFLFFFPPKNALLPIVLLILYISNWTIFFKLKGQAGRIYIPTVITVISLNLLMAVNFYPNLLLYQSSSQAGRYVRENRISDHGFYNYKRSSFSLDFYARQITPGVDLNEIKNLGSGSWLFTDENGLFEIGKTLVKFKVVKVFSSFRVTGLKLPFLMRETRETTLKNDYIIEIQ